MFVFLRRKEYKTMRTLRKVILILFICFSITSLSFTTLAHPGSLDENGGHYNRTTGEYHYHDGDNTGGSSILFEWILPIGFFVCAIVFVIVAWIIGSIQEIKDRKMKFIKEQEELLEYERNRNIYYNMYANKDIRSFCSIPDGTHIDSAGLPSTNDSGEYGLYTIYVRYLDQVTTYHIKKDCCGALLKCSNIVEYPNAKPCQRCSRNHFIDISWYSEYSRIEKIKKEYDIP